MIDSLMQTKDPMACAKLLSDNLIRIDCDALITLERKTDMPAWKRRMIRSQVMLNCVLGVSLYDILTDPIKGDWLDVTTLDCCPVGTIFRKPLPPHSGRNIRVLGKIDFGDDGFTEFTIFLTPRHEPDVLNRCFVNKSDEGKEIKIARIGAIENYGSDWRGPSVSWIDGVMKRIV